MKGMDIHGRIGSFTEWNCRACRPAL
jgi:hypothetical protein